MIYESISRLLDYAEGTGLIKECDRIYSANRIIEALGLDEYEETSYSGQKPLHEILEELIDFAVEKGLIGEGVTAADLFDTKIMGLLTPRPGEVIEKFNADYSDSPQKATDNYYKFSCDTNYIRRDRIARDLKWTSDTDYGTLDITVNLSKPEKDPKAIAAAKNAPVAGYPKCMLCRECEGYAGRINFPARGNHRVIPVTINDTEWRLQYSPYVYYNEHCIVFNAEHTPMAINDATFRKLLDFVAQFPHYFVGSNADLPIVGGSILSHDHFQGGHYTFAMEKAPIETEIKINGFEGLEAGIVKWPMSVIRLRSEDKYELISAASKILAKWRIYTDEDAFIFAETDGEKHNTITPIARKSGKKFELDLVLRNNITTEEHPLGVYHPHTELHHIKKENIGLIEVMGLAVLPARLKDEMAVLEELLPSGGDIAADERVASHAEWAKELCERYTFTKENVGDILKKEIGIVFSKVLEHAGVYKRDADGKQAFLKFIQSI